MTTKEQHKKYISQHKCYNCGKKLESEYKKIRCENCNKIQNKCNTKWRKKNPDYFKKWYKEHPNYYKNYHKLRISKTKKRNKK